MVTPEYLKAKRINYPVETAGYCDHCGKPLDRGFAWVSAESTGCSKLCAETDAKNDEVTP